MKTVEDGGKQLKKDEVIGKWIITKFLSITISQLTSLQVNKFTGLWKKLDFLRSHDQLYSVTIRHMQQQKTSPSALDILHMCLSFFYLATEMRTIKNFPLMPLGRNLGTLRAPVTISAVPK